MLRFRVGETYAVGWWTRSWAWAWLLFLGCSTRTHKNKVDSFSRVFSIRVSRGETWPTLVAERSWATWPESIVNTSNWVRVMIMQDLNDLKRAAEHFFIEERNTSKYTGCLFSSQKLGFNFIQIQVLVQGVSSSCTVSEFGPWQYRECGSWCTSPGSAISVVCTVPTPAAMFCIISTCFSDLAEKKPRPDYCRIWEFHSIRI